MLQSVKKLVRSCKVNEISKFFIWYKMKSNKMYLSKHRVWSAFNLTSTLTSSHLLRLPWNSFFPFIYRVKPIKLNDSFFWDLWKMLNRLKIQISVCTFKSNMSFDALMYSTFSLACAYSQFTIFTLCFSFLSNYKYVHNMNVFW